MIVYVDEALSQINRLSRIQFWSDFILGKNVVFSYQYVLCKLMIWYFRLFQISIHISNFQRNVILRKIGYQVWSLTQFYSVDFSQSSIGGKKVCFQQTHNQGLLKKPLKGPRRRQGSCWEERKRIVLPRWGVLDSTSRQINEFSQKGKRKKLS